MRKYLPSREAMRERVTQWLLEGIAPERLALTLAVGFVLGCIPLLGIPTGLCVVVALAFRLNQPVIQAANYAAMPFQMALIVPFARLGGKLVPHISHTALDLNALTRSPLKLVMHSSAEIVTQLGILAGQAFLAWLILAVPVAVLLTATLTGVFRRVPVLAATTRRD